MGYGLDGPKGAAGSGEELGESRENRRGSQAWHKLLIILEKRHFDLRLSVCLPWLSVLNISVGSKPKKLSKPGILRDCSLS